MTIALKLHTVLLLLTSRSAGAERLFGEFATKHPITIAPTTRSPSTNTSPTPNSTQQCYRDNKRWKYTFSEFEGGRWQTQQVGCDDSRVSCDKMGDIGLARDHCCKCKVECMGQCDDSTRQTNTGFLGDNSKDDDSEASNDGEDSLNFADIHPVLGAAVVLLCCFCALMREIVNHFDLRATRQTMNQRRQQQRGESNNQVITEENRKTTRYELFATKFHFQMVLPDKSNITADRVRNSAGKQDEECPKDDDETELEFDDDNTATSMRPQENTFPACLNRQIMPAPKDECCICLDSYTEGETICAPITTNCNHVFHKDCIYEWLKTKDRCPLCRVELLKE